MSDGPVPKHVIQAENDRLRGEVERLTRECDDAKHHAEARLTALREVEDELAAAEAKFVKLREALEEAARHVEQIWAAGFGPSAVTAAIRALKGETPVQEDSHE